MKITRINLCILLVLIVSVGLTGCSNNSSKNRLKKEFITYLNTKYEEDVKNGEEFKYVPDTYSGDGMKFSSKKYSDLGTPWQYIEVSKNWDESKIYDNYPALKYQHKVEKAIQVVTESVYGSCEIINFPEESANERFTKDLTLETYLSDFWIQIDLIVNKSDESTKEKDIEAVIVGLKNANIHVGGIELYYQQEKSVEGIISNKWVGSFSIDKDFIIYSKEWRY